MRSRILNLKVFFSPPLLLSLIIIVNCVRNKLLFFPPSWCEGIIFSLAVFTSALILLGMGFLFFQDKNKAFVFSSLALIFIFFYYDLFYRLFNIKFIYNFIYSYLFQKFHLILIVFGIILLVLIFIFLRKTRKQLGTLSRYLSVFFVLLLTFEVSQLFFSNEFVVEAKKEFNEQQIKTTKNPKRSIYYLVFDAYTSSGSLKKYWNYDNKELADFLAGKGFFIAEKSKCNYNSTPFSILSALNMSYLNMESHEEAQRVHISKVYDVMKENAVVRLLSANGYKILNLSLFDLQQTKAFYTDPYYHKPSLFDRTIFYLIADKAGVTSERRLFKNLATINKEIISEIPEAKKNAKPVFCYAHIMMPHEPFFFDEAGNLMPDDYALSSQRKKEKYLSQLKYANQRLMQAIENILYGSMVKPIVIIQGDHGYRYLEEMNYPEQLEESKTIFNAYLFPDDTLQYPLYDSISPVNSFRIIFNNYFGTELPLLKDTSFNTEIKNKN